MCASPGARRTGSCSPWACAPWSAQPAWSLFQNPRTRFFNAGTTGEVAFALESAGWPEEKIRARVGRAFHELGLESLAERSIFRLSRWAAPEDRPREHLGPAAAEPAAGRADEQSGYALHRGYRGLRREREGIGPLDPGGRAPTDPALRHRRYLCPPRRRPYGAGKTTLCRALCGFERKARRTLFLDGRRPSRRHRIRASSTVFQDVRYQLFAESAAAAEVTFGLSRRQASAVDTDAVLRELALDDVAGRHPATPSGRRRGRQRERFKPASRHASATGSAAARRPRRADPGRSTSPCRA